MDDTSIVFPITDFHHVADNIWKSALVAETIPIRIDHDCIASVCLDMSEHELRTLNQAIVTHVAAIIVCVVGFVSVVLSVVVPYAAYGTLALLLPVAVHAAFTRRSLTCLMLRTFDFWWILLNQVALFGVCVMLLDSSMWMSCAMLTLVGVSVLLADADFVTTSHSQWMLIMYWVTLAALALLVLTNQTKNVSARYDFGIGIGIDAFQTEVMFANRIVTLVTYFLRDIINSFMHPECMLRLRARIASSPSSSFSASTSTSNQVAPSPRPIPIPSSPQVSQIHTLVHYQAAVAPAMRYLHPKKPPIQLDNRVVISYLFPRFFTHARTYMWHRAYFTSPVPAILFVVGACMGIVGLYVSAPWLEYACLPFTVTPMVVRLLFAHPRVCRALLSNFDVWWVCGNLMCIFASAVFVMADSSTLGMWFMVSLASCVMMLSDSMKLSRRTLLPGMTFCLLASILLLVSLCVGALHIVPDSPVLYNVFLNCIFTLCAFNAKCVIKLAWYPHSLIVLESSIESC